MLLALFMLELYNVLHKGCSIYLAKVGLFPLGEGEGAKEILDAVAGMVSLRFEPDLEHLKYKKKC